ncbi:MAG: MFS transporter [Actinomycetota bacterium]|nr:MFS transporter [Actinomycetota bacterium]
MLGRVLDDSYAPEVRRDLTAFAAARTTTNACYRFVGPFIATIARGLHVSLADIGVAIAVSELAGLASPLIGRLVDRLGARRAVAVGLGATLAGTCLAAASQGVAMLAIALVLLGQGNITFYLGIGAWIAGHVPYERRGRVTGLIEVSWAFGLLLGVSTMGLVTAISNWRVGYLSGAAAVAGMAIVVIGRIDSPQPQPRHRAVADSDRAGGRLVSRAWLILLAGFAGTAASHALVVTFGSWLEDEFGLSPAGLSAVTFLLGAGELFATLSVARFTDVWGKPQSVAVGAALMIPASAALALWHHNLVVGVVLLAVAVLGFEFSVVSAISLGTGLVPGSPARGLGLLIGVDTIGRSVMSVPATRLYSSSGIAWPAALCAILATVSVVAISFSSRGSRW